MKAFFSKVPRFILVLVGLAIAGFLREPIEARLRDRLVEANLLLPPPGQTAMEQMSQSALMGTLGGLRSLVATYLVLEAFEHFSVKDWEELAQSYNVITSLEPRDESHWVSAVWHLGINATANMQIDERIPSFERERRFREYAAQAINFAERGLQQNPQSVDIRMQLAEVYREKLRDNCETARVYGEAMIQPGAPGMARRFHGYYLARCPGNEQEAYEYLMALYREGLQQRKPTLIKEIKNLEEYLKIPVPRRIPDDDPDRRPGEPAKSTNPTLPGGLEIP